MAINQQSQPGQPSEESTGMRELTDKRDMTRRKIVVTGASAVAALGLGTALAANAVAGERGDGSEAGAREQESRAAAEECYVLTSVATEGPYYIDADKLRTDVTEDREGIPLLLRVKVIDSESCQPIRDAAVDIWHCDAGGIYSGYEAKGNGTEIPPSENHEDPTDANRYLRGTSRTDRDGFVTFKTIFPGWYTYRTVHIHAKVHVNGEWTDAGYEGGNTCHTGQLYFDEESVLATSVLEPYVSNTAERTTLDDDAIYDDTGTRGGLLKLRYDKRDIAKGVHASITVGVDPEATNTGRDL